MEGKVLKAQIDEQIVFSQLNMRTSSVWSLLLASGYETGMWSALSGGPHCERNSQRADTEVWICF